jgi:poly(3-hydroxyalkanoate) synthetase
VLRTEVFELIQYGAQAEEAYEVPLLLVPLTINTYYVILANERSLVESSVRQARQVFLVSWRSPDAAQRRVRLRHPTSGRSSTPSTRSARSRQPAPPPGS